jgi:NADPH2:quinone reductase
VRVVASGTNPVDVKVRSSGDAMGLETPIILGLAASGVVEEVGAGVTDLAPGDEVYFTPEVFGPRSNGGYAEYNVAPADIVAKKPASLSHEEAAAVPLAEAIVRRLEVKVGETVLVHGGPAAWAPSPSTSPKPRAPASSPQPAPPTRRRLRL